MYFSSKNRDGSTVANASPRKDHHHSKGNLSSSSNSSSPCKKSDDRSSRDKERDRDRHRHSQHHRSRRVNIGVQCRRDKTLDKTVGFGESTKYHSNAVGAGFQCYGFCMANAMPSLEGKYKMGHLMKVETSPNGLGKVLHMWQNEVDMYKLDEEESEMLARDFIKETFLEMEDGYAKYCCSVVHGAAQYLPDFLEYLGTEHGNMTIKHGIIGQARELETTTMALYREKVTEQYKAGTFRFGHLDNVSLVSTTFR